MRRSLCRDAGGSGKACFWKCAVSCQWRSRLRSYVTRRLDSRGTFERPSMLQWSGGINNEPLECAEVRLTCDAPVSLKTGVGV
jgi:hypothetical protein